MSDHNHPAPSRRSRIVIAVIVIVVIAAFVVVHLTGVIGLGSH